MNLLKRIGAVLVGLLIAMVVIGLFEWGGMYIHQAPKVDYHDPKALADMMRDMPLSAFLWLLLGYAVASVSGGVVATLISGREKNLPAMIVGVVLTLGGLMNQTEIPHPMWFAVVSTLVYVPMAWVGYIVSKKKHPAA